MKTQKVIVGGILPIVILLAACNPVAPETKNLPTSMSTATHSTTVPPTGIQTPTPTHQQTSNPQANCHTQNQPNHGHVQANNRLSYCYNIAPSHAPHDEPFSCLARLSIPIPDNHPHRHT